MAVLLAGLLVLVLDASAQADDGYGNSAANATGPIGFDAAHSSYNGAMETVNDQDVFFFYLPAGDQPTHFVVTNTTPNDEAHGGLLCCQLSYGIADSDGSVLYSSPSGGIGPGESGRLDYTLTGPAKYYFFLRCERDAFADPTCSSDTLPLNWHYSVSPSTSFSVSAPPTGVPPSNPPPIIGPPPPATPNPNRTRCHNARRDLTKANAAVRRDRRRLRQHHTRNNRRRLTRDQQRANALKRRVRRYCR